MSTQDDSGIVFTLSSRQQNFRLLELPPELVTIISAHGESKFEIKSGDSKTPETANSNFAVLCTKEKTYQLRQVQTSNSVYIVEPSSLAKDDEIPQSCISAIASCTNSLELFPVQDHAHPHLVAVLPLYDDFENLKPPANSLTKEHVFGDIPLSTGQCENAWRDLFAFETADGCYRPSAGVLFHVWQSALRAALAEGIRLDSVFQASALANAVEDEDWPLEILHAFLLKTGSEEEAIVGGKFKFDQAKLISAVGKVNLETMSKQESTIPLENFLGTWKDSLPETYRDGVKLGCIDGCYELSSPSTISFKDSLRSHKDSNAGSASKSGTAGRKWHEKFKNKRG